MVCRREGYWECWCLGYGINVDVVSRYCFLASSFRTHARSSLSFFLSFFLSLSLSVCVSSSTTFFSIPLLDFHRSCRCVTVSKSVYLLVDIF